ncbi:MAG TPA: phosphoglucosamine mutase [Fimbriimonas sp.]|nr:phosphoglucosamine mutase [Fimbriimonas sp.]
MSRKYFGTDGVRGVANKKLTPELAMKLGQGAGRWLSQTDRARRVVIGRDTRKSGTMLGAALAAGFNSVGIEVVTLGVAPTPAIAFVARMGEYGMGAIVSASHNPAPDNGIKFVGHNGAKLPDEVELTIEGLMDSEESRPTGRDIGAIRADRSELAPYMDALVNVIPERLDGMKIALDCAHGAGYELGPEALRRLGAEVVLIGASPDGLNINAEGGATKPETIQALASQCGAVIGCAYDGDADRVIFSDEKGRLINGDRTIGIWAAHMQRAGKLNPPVIVGTVMSNVGFEAYVTAAGIRLERTPVGDKYVAQRIQETNALVGGEQSGHIIFPQHGPTGDGLTTMMELLRVLRLEGRPASSFYDEYEPWPQVMVNVHVSTTREWQTKIGAELASAEEEIRGHGRIVVRPSGTQPVIRVMVEADEYALRDRVADKLVAALEREMGGEVHGRVDLTHSLGE